MATAATLRTRYRRTVLGVAWLPIAPAVLVATLVVALSRIIGRGEAALELVLGLILWNFFAAGTSEGLRGLANRKGLLAAAGRSASAVLAATLVPHVLELLVALATFTACQAWLGVAPALVSAAAVPPILELVALTYGLTLALTALEARLGDVEHAWRLLLAVGFWVTPIVYPVSSVPERYQALFEANPLGRIIEATRAPMLAGTVPAAAEQLVTLAVVVGVTLGGMLLFRRTLPLILERM